MPVPNTCTNPRCSNHTTPTRRWPARFGSYHTIAHGTVRRYQCKACQTSKSDQPESICWVPDRLGWVAMPAHEVVGLDPGSGRYRGESRMRNQQGAAYYTSS